MNKKTLVLVSLLLTSCILFSACVGKKDSSSGLSGVNDAPKSYQESINVGSNEVKVYGSGQEPSSDYITVGFDETNDLLYNNEYQGWVVLEEPLLGGLPSVGYKGNLPEVKAVSLSTGWSCFEATPGNFDWTAMDETIEYWVGQGKTINMRLCTDGLELNQGVVNGCPEWLFHEPYNVPKVINQGDIFADLSSVVYQTELRRFLSAFAKHYTSEDYPYRDAIEVVELRGYGMVGEWHSGWNTYNSIEERTAALCETIDAWREAWGDKLLVLSCTYEFLNNMWGVNSAQTYEDFMYWMGYDYALTLDNITFRRDGIAFALQQWDQRMATDYYYLNTGLPLFGEIGDGYHKHTEDDSYPLFEAMNEALHKWKVNYNTVIGWVAQDFDIVIKNEEEHIEYFNRYQGYRLVPDQVNYSANVKAGDKFYFNSFWSNKGVGRLWVDHDLTVYFENELGQTVYSGADARFTPTAINGGESHYFNLSYSLPENLEKGTYTVKFAITDKEGKPAIEMPISGNDGAKKYYLGQVTVGDNPASDIAGMDDLGSSTSFTAVGNGKITNRLVNVDGTKAIVGEGSAVFAKGKKLENGKTYYISFDYKANKAKKDITITDSSRYLVGAYSDKAGWGDSYSWLDVSNNISHRTATIKVPNDGNEYYVAFGGENDVAQIAIDNVCVASANNLNPEFRINPNYTENKGNGVYEIKSTINQNWAQGLQLKQKLDSYSTYMITFDAQTVTEISGGGFFYVALVDPSMNYDVKKESIKAFTEDRIGSFWTPADYGYMQYSYLFTTEEYTDDWHLVFGVRNRGAVSIKNVKLTKISTDYTYDADDIKNAHNVVPNKNINVDENGLVENFEAGVFNGGAMFPGMSMGVIKRGTHVISGNYSCYVENYNTLHQFYEFNVFCQTNLADVRFSPNTTYRVRFKFMVIADVKPEEGGQFYCLAREDGSFAHDKGIFEWKSGYEVGEVYSVEYEFTTGPASNYYFMWGVHWYGAIAIDDITFDKVDVPTGQTTPIVTKGHAYEITQDVLYKR